MAYSEEQKDNVFNRVIKEIQSGKALRNVLKEEGMPSSQTFYIWLDEDELKSKQYAGACEDRAEAIFEEMIEIADDGSNDYMTITKGIEKYNVEDKEVTNRSRLRIDTRKWMLSKLMPKKYGDKLDITTDGERLNSPIMNFDPLNSNE